MNKSIYFVNEETHALGRNGTMRCIGVNLIENPNEKSFVIAPINSNDKVGRSYVKLPQEAAISLARTILNATEGAVITWGIADFEGTAVLLEDDVMEEESLMMRPIMFDRSKFPAALEHMERNHDATLGINWDTIDSYLNNQCKMEVKVPKVFETTPVDWTGDAGERDKLVKWIVAYNVDDAKSWLYEEKIPFQSIQQIPLPLNEPCIDVDLTKEDQS